MYIVESRYEYWSNYDGKQWTKWFHLHGAKFDTLKEAEEELKLMTKKSVDVDKATRLKHEFRIIEK